MRIIKESTLTKLCEQDRYKKAEPAVRSWIFEVRHSNWNNAGQLKAKYKNAGVISSKRVVFDISGNNYRLVVDIEYQLKIVFVVWFGTYNEYDNVDVDVNEISYDSKSNKK